MARLPKLTGVGGSEHARWVKFHKHEGLELIYVNKGHCRTMVAGAEEALEAWAGWLHVIPANTLHDQQRMEMSRTTYLTVDTADVRTERWPRLLYLGPESPEARWLCDIPDLARTFSGDGEVIGGLLLALLHKLGARIAARGNGLPVPQSVATAVSFVRDHVAEELTVAAVGRAAGLSGSRMAALFKRHCGCGIIAYQQRLRMDKARRLLQDPYMRVSEAALGCGYRDVNYFIRLFRRRHGVAPTAWRRRGNERRAKAATCT